jgi:hypothetical protein
MLPRQEVVLEIRNFLIGCFLAFTVIILKDPAIASKWGLVMGFGGVDMESRGTLILYYRDKGLGEHLEGGR